MKKIFRLIIPLTLILFGAVPANWFLNKKDVLINGVDTNFPLDPVVWFERRMYVWNSIANAGLDFSSSIAGLFFHSIQVFPYILGFSLQYTQIFSTVFWFSLIVISSYILARKIFPRKALVQLLFVNLYSFNIFLFNTWENIKVANLSIMASIPFALFILITLNENSVSKIKAAFCLVFVGIVVSGAGINPAYFISFFSVLVLYLISQILNTSRQEIIFKSKNLILLTIVILLVNAFWILPTSNYILKNIPTGESIGKIGFNNWVDSLSENTSLLNVMRMQGAWDWYAFDSITGLPLYIPYALNYFYNSIFILFSFLITGISMLGLLLYDKHKKHLSLFFGILLVIGIFLGAGTHPPTGDIYRWFLNHLPFFSLFRSPWYIFTPLLILAIAGLCSLFVERLFELKDRMTGYSSRTQLFIRIALNLSVAIMIIGNLLYCYPLVTGKIFRPNRHDGFFVKFPSYITDAGKWLSTDHNGRIIGYPDNEIEEFKWGYRGIESILALLVDRDVLFSPLNDPDSSVALLIREFYLNLKKGQIDSAKSIAAKLNIGLIHEKQDQKSITLPLPIQISNLAKTSFGAWNFYLFPNQQYLPKIFSTTNISLANFSSDISFVNALANKELLLNAEDEVVGKIPHISEISNKMILSRNLQLQDFEEFQLSPSRLANRLISRDLGKVIFTFEIPEDGVYQPMIEKYHLQDFGIDLSKGLELELDNTKVAWNARSSTESYLYLDPVFLSKGAHRVMLKLANSNLVKGGDFESGMTFDKGGEGKGEGVYEISEIAGNKFLSINNIDRADISADFKITSFDPLSVYYFEIKYKQIYGNNTNILMRQSNVNTIFKAQVERMPNHPEWKLASFYFDPVKADSNMYVELLAPHVSDPLGTKILYDDLKAHKVFTNKLLFMHMAEKEGTSLLSEPKVNFNKISPVEYQLDVTEAYKPHIIVFSENYSPDWKVEVTDKDGLKLKVKLLHFSANLYANAWYIEGVPSEYKLKISHNAQIFAWIGFAISSLTILTVAVMFIRSLKYGSR